MAGEFELIELLRERLAAAGVTAGERLVLASGDDAAVSVPGGATATSVDAVVDGVHFERAVYPPEAIGAKALGAALSDLAAMGAAAGEAYVQLGLPPDAGEDELQGIADGIAAVAAEAGAAIAGGDVVASPVLFLALTVVGHAPDPGGLVTRSGAEPGDALLVTGPLGGAAAGLLLLRGDLADDAVGEALAGKLRARQLTPEPRLAEGAVLAAAGARALIDISDGLAGDAAHLARAAGARLEIEIDRVPLAPGLAAVAGAFGVELEALALGGGEDYELLAALPADGVERALAALRELGAEPATVGRVTTGEGVVLRDASGAERSVAGYDQIRSRASAERS